MSPATETIETTRMVEFFNVEHPGDTIFIAQDPEYDKLVNKALANDKYATFQAGLFSTADPVIIAALNSPKLRAKGVRCMENPADIAEYGTHDQKMSFIEQEVERRVAEEVEARMAEQNHAAASPFETSKAQAAESVPPQE